jgi:short-subunit dehydrogenase
MRLEGKLALITGAGSGIGRALAVEAAGRGVHLILTGRDRGAIEETRELVARQVDVQLCPGDVTQPGHCRELKDEVLARGGRLDLLIHNAGAQWAGPLDHVGDRALEAMVDTNLLAPMMLTRALIDPLRAAAPSRIVFIGSMFGEIAFPLFSGYSATKAGLRGYADAVRRELRAEGVGVTYAAPRATATAMTARTPHLSNAFAMSLDAPDQVARRILRGVRLGARTVYPGPGEWLIATVHALAPTLIDHALVRQLRQAIAQLGPSWQSVQGPAFSAWRRYADVHPVKSGKEPS